ncbi:MAG: glycoside hydrolase family 27 protein [Christensenellales bacterium]
MKRNGMCPLCYLKQLFTPKSRITSVDIDEQYDNGVKTPPMGWSSWNTFKNHIDQDMILETANAMRDKGLIKAGYRYLNLDDCWHDSQRTADGELQGDRVKFSMGIGQLVKQANEMGLKVGAYSSNGIYTCEDLPASLDHEEKDALTLARWGIEFFKYDFCHNKPISSYAPLVYAIDISEIGTGKVLQSITCDRAVVRGTAKLMPTNKVACKRYISGMDKAKGEAVFDNVYVKESGEYILTLNIVKKGSDYEKFLRAKINGKAYYFDIPPQKIWNTVARFSMQVTLQEGINVIELTNPVATRADSAMLQYYKMGKALENAAKQVAAETNQPVRPITFSVCEWGKNEPHNWAAKTGNMWRTTPDIRPIWWWIKQIYEHNVKLYEYSGVGHYNDPDMLEVGNGKLTYEQNKSHFALWCMMNSPLMLGNDVRNISDEVLKIVTNVSLISINQDALGKQAKRISRGGVDVLAKPLEKGKVAVCFFNKSSFKAGKRADWDKIAADGYIGASWDGKTIATDVWTGKTYTLDELKEIKLNACESKVYVIG